MNILPAIRGLILGASISGIQSDTLKSANMPDQPVDVTVLRDSGGIAPDENDTTTAVWQHRTFQILIRAKSFDEGMNRAEALRALLVQRIDKPIILTDGTESVLKFKNILMMSEFQSIGKDDLGRYEISGNFKTMVRRRTDEEINPPQDGTND